MPPEDKKSNTGSSDRDNAANVVREQLDALYTNQPTVSTHANSQQAPTVNGAQVDHMQQYHTQWQDYYQKYYERYYVGHLHQAINDQRKTTLAPQQQREEAIVDLRQKIVVNAKESAKKARKSRHFIPIASAFAVVLVVAFLQYNGVLMATVQAYVSPGAIDPQNIVVDPTANVQVGPDPKLIIPKINVNVPVIYNVATDHDAQMAAMQKGVAHFAIPGANSVPGQVGNTTFSGHSSNDLFDPGDYKFIFAQLDKLQQGDTIYVNYNSVRYTYTVTKKEVVKPTQVDKLTYATDKPVLTLITCTPLGTSTNRLLVTAEQVAPDPAKAAAATAPSTTDKAAIPGNGATALEKLFGGR